MLDDDIGGAGQGALVGRISEPFARDRFKLGILTRQRVSGDRVAFSNEHVGALHPTVEGLLLLPISSNQVTRYPPDSPTQPLDCGLRRVRLDARRR